MQRLFFKSVSHHSGCLLLFLRVMWIIIIIIITVNPSLMHIFFVMFGFTLFIAYFSGDGSVRYPETSSYRNIFLLLTIKTGRGGLVDITFHFSRV